MRVAGLCLCACGRVGFDAIGGDAVDAAASHTVFAISESATQGTVMLSLDLSTAELTYITSFSGFGVLGGLARWDANTFYMSGNDVVVELTLPSLQPQRTQTATTNLASLERNGDELLAVGDNGDVLHFAPGGTIAAFPLVDAAGPIPVDGGDLARMSSGAWLWWSNVRTQLYVIDPSGGQAVAMGSPNPSVPYVSGMVIDDSGRLFVTSGVTDELIELDPPSGAIVDRKPLCMPCPGTPYNLDSGDLTRAP